jgi:60 kDa SS-A/Ro ribonucleoprotein
MACNWTDNPDLPKTQTYLELLWRDFMRQALLNATETNRVSVRVKTSPDQVQNSDGGFVYQASDETRLRRFLILGTDGGSYYASERELTFENVTFVRDMVRSSESDVLRIILDVSSNTLAPKHSPTLYALACVFQYGTDWRGARSAFTEVVRTPTHLFEFIDYAKTMGGLGPKKRKAIQSWFLNKSADSLAYQAVKYRQRNGWTLADAMRLARPKLVDPGVAHFILHGNVKFSMVVPEIINGFNVIQSAQTPEQVLAALGNYGHLPWETIPTQFLKDARVWKSLFYNGQLRGQALLRNMKRLNELGAFSDRRFMLDVASELQDQEMIRKGRLHPANYFNALYNSGSVPVAIEAALEAGFYLAFKNVESTGKNILVAVDVSASMTWGTVAGMNITPNQGAALMALVIAGSEPNADIVAYGSTIVPVKIRGNMPIKDVVRMFGNMNFGGTDPSLAIKYAESQGKVYDGFISITDSEANGGLHIDAELERYRQRHGVNSRMVTVGMVSNRYSLGSQFDKRHLDVVGFSSDAPKLISAFVAGKF